MYPDVNRTSSFEVFIAMKPYFLVGLVDVAKTVMTNESTNRELRGKSLKNF